MNTKEAKRLAREIAREIFTDGRGKVASRVVMEFYEFDKKKFDGPGYIEPALEGIILKKLLDAKRAAKKGKSDA